MPNGQNGKRRPLPTPATAAGTLAPGVIPQRPARGGRAPGAGTPVGQYPGLAPGVLPPALPSELVPGGYTPILGYGASVPPSEEAGRYLYGHERPTFETTQTALGSLLPYDEQAAAREALTELERRSPLRGGQVWIDPRRAELPLETHDYLRTLSALVPSRLGLTAYYGDLARSVQEVVGAPELGAAREFIASRMEEGVPESVEKAFTEDLRQAYAARGLQYSPATAADEARKLTRFREEQRQNLLGPAMTLGFQTLAMSGFPEMGQIGPISFPPVGTAAGQAGQISFAREQQGIQAGMAGMEMLMAGLALGGLPALYPSAYGRT